MKKLLSFLLVMVISVTAIIALVPPVEASAAILNSANVKGSDFTDSEALADMLDVVFSGDIDIYNYDCDNKIVKGEASMPLGTKMSTSACFYIKSKASGSGYSGQQCYIYANAVYNKIFNEVVYHGGNLAHSKVVISGGSKSVSYDMFKNAGVRCGAYMRTTGNSNGSYHYKVGHSMIVLSYDSSYITYLGGNQANGGEIDIRKETWSEFNNGRVGGVGRYISHIVQPTDEYYEKLYPSHKCTKFEGVGVCTECGKTYDWQGTFSTAEAGTYKLVKDCTPRTDAPYSDATQASTKLKSGTTVNVLGSYINAYGSKFYKFTYNSGNNEGYAYYTFFELTNYNALNVTCKGFTPSENESLPLGQGYPVWGTVSSNYPLKKVVAKLDGSEYTTWTASNDNTTSFAINPTDINNKLKFGSLSAGKHTVTLIATDIHGRTQTFLTRSFNMVSTSCSHSYGSSYKTDANNHWKVCSKCGSSASVEAHVYTNSCDTSCNTCGYTRTITHTYSNDCDASCNVCGATRTAIHSYKRNSNADYHWKECTSCGEKTNYAEHIWIITPFEQHHTFTCGECYYAMILDHEYSNNCDATCNICEETRTPIHTYDNDHDPECNVCDEVRTVTHNIPSKYDTNQTYHWKDCTECGRVVLNLEKHNYSSDCDNSCNTCGYIRNVTHTYSNACDTSCNVCGATRATSHEYDNACDKDCNICGAKRTTNHKYSNACDKTCDACGAVRTVPDHVYDHGCDSSCNNCGYSRPTNHSYDNNCDSDCNTCGAIRSVSHSYTSSYFSDDTTHWRQCSSCGHKGYIENHIPGAPATETNPQRCLACEYVIQPALGHTHSFGDTYYSDEYQHWHQCTDESCGAKKDIGDHVFGQGEVTKEPTTTEKGEKTYTCSVCGETKYEEIDVISGGIGNIDDVEKPGNGELSGVEVNPLGETKIITVVLVAVATSSVAVTCTVLIMNKKSAKIKKLRSDSEGDGVDGDSESEE